jgi:signal transduction histidine kinase
LPCLDAVVKQYERETSQKLYDLEILEIGCLFGLFIVWVGTIFIIFKPMEVQIQQKHAKFVREEQMRKDNEKFSALGKVSSGMAHEINNALQPIIGTGDFILEELEEKSDTMYVEQMKVMLRGATHIHKILQNVLTYTHKDSSNYQVYEAHSFIVRGIDFYKDILSSNTIFNTEIDDVLKKVTVLGNETEIVQVFGNLFKNAIHAMDGAGEINIEAGLDYLSSDKTKKAVCIKIQDCGHGMPENVLKKVFDPFFTTKDVSEGTGLGLSTVFGIVERHNGIVEVESSVGEGTSFYISLPIIEKGNT